MKDYFFYHHRHHIVIIVDIIVIIIIIIIIIVIIIFVETKNLNQLLTMTFHLIPVSEDLVVQFYDKNISTQELLIKLNMTRHNFSVNNLCPSSRFSCETVCPLNESGKARERMFQKSCYCDTLCLELGDCCYDYFVRYTKWPGHTSWPSIFFNYFQPV